MNYDSPHTARAPQEPELNEYAARALEAGQGPVAARGDADEVDHGQPATLEQQVVALSEGGSTASEIVETIAAAGETISVQKVGGILRRYKSNPELFE